MIIEITITAGTTPDLEVSYDSGVTWALLITNIALNTVRATRTLVTDTDLLNFRTPTVGGLTLGRFVVIGSITAA